LFTGVVIAVISAFFIAELTPLGTATMNATNAFYNRIYGTENRYHDVTALLQDEAQKGRLDIVVDNETLRCDPVPGVGKRLVAYNSFAGMQFSITIPKNQTITIPQWPMPPPPPFIPPPNTPQRRTA
jgi:hypothetical protein